MLANLRIGYCRIARHRGAGGRRASLARAVPEETFVEYRMGEPHDAPIAIAAARDGSIWFTLDRADAIGRLRNGRVERLPTSNRNIEPLGLAVAADGSAWFTDSRHAALRTSAAPARSRDSRSTRRSSARAAGYRARRRGLVRRIDRLSSVTRLKDGNFTRHQIDARARRPLWGRRDGRRRRMGDTAKRQPAIPAPSRQDQ